MAGSVDAWTPRYRVVVGVVTKADAKPHFYNGDIRFETRIEIDSLPGAFFTNISPFRIDVGEKVRLYHIDVREFEICKAAGEECDLEPTMFDILNGKEIIFSVNLFRE